MAKLALVGLAFFLISRKVSWHDEVQLRDGKVLDESYEGNDILITAIVPNTLRHRFESFIA